MAADKTKGKRLWKSFDKAIPLKEEKDTIFSLKKLVLYRIIENVENILILRSIIPKITVTQAEANFVDCAKDIFLLFGVKKKNG
jgi:hypothetical protein